MTQWVTKQLGIKNFEETLDESGYASIIVDVSDVKPDDTNDEKVIYGTITRIFVAIAARRYKVILQSKDDTVAPVFAAMVIAYSIQTDLDQALKIVFGKKKITCNEGLVNSAKRVLELMAVG